jgi:regulatory protein
MIPANLRYHLAMGKSLPPPATRLWDAALRYLGRYEASTHSLRRVLKRRMERWARLDQAELDDAGLALIETTIVRLRASGALDDARYAETKALSLTRGGRSERAIRAYLAERGVTAELADQALAQRASEAAAGFDFDYAAALRFAKKRRIGRFRPAASRRALRQRDLAALGRAGFSWEIAIRVIDLGDDDS